MFRPIANLSGHQLKGALIIFSSYLLCYRKKNSILPPLANFKRQHGIMEVLLIISASCFSMTVMFNLLSLMAKILGNLFSLLGGWGGRERKKARERERKERLMSFPKENRHKNIESHLPSYYKVQWISIFWCFSLLLLFCNLNFKV